MNSKEALIILRAKGVIDTRYCTKIELDKCLNVIEKELEELEKYKKVFNTSIQDLITNYKVLDIIFNNLEIPLGKNTCYLIDKENLSQEDNEKILQAFKAWEEVQQ